MFGTNRHGGTIQARARRIRLIGSVALIALYLGSIGAPPSAGAPASPLAITTTDSADPVVSGAQLSYTIGVTNTGGSKVSNVTLIDQLNGVGGIGTPPMLQLTSTVGSCVQQSLKVTCSAGTLQGGQSWTVTITGVVTAPAGSTLNNTAVVSGTRSAQTFSSQDVETTAVIGSGPGGPASDLTISKTGPLSVAPETFFNYVLTVNNIGTANATGIKVLDTLPATVTNISAVGTSLFVCGVVAQTVTCNGGQVNAGSNATITITAKSPPSGTLENTASVDPDDTIDEGQPGPAPGDPAELNNTSATVSTAVGQPPPPPIDIFFNAPADPHIATPGDLVTFEVEVLNGSLGRADANAMTLATQGLEASSIQVLSATSESGTTPECVVEAPKVTCTWTRLATGDSALFSIRGQIIASAGSALLTTATINTNILNDGYDDTATKQTTVMPSRDLTIIKTDSPDAACARTWPGPGGVCQGGLLYTLIVGNSGINVASGVVVRDVLPPDTVYDAPSLSAPDFAGGCTLDVPTNVLTCTGGTIGPMSTVTISFKVVAPATTGTIANTATVDPGNTIFEADEGNNSASASTLIKTGIDLTLVKDDEPGGNADGDDAPGFDPIATSGTQTYRIVADNIGTQDATGITIRDVLPAGTRFLSVAYEGGAPTSDNGFTCTHDGSPTGGVVNCVGGSLLGTASEFYFDPPPGPDDTATILIRVFARPTIGSMHNEVRIDPDGQIAEANEANNLDTENTTVQHGDHTIGAFHELVVDKTGDANATPLGLISYDLVVTNNGTDEATGVTVTDLMPAGTAFVEAKDSVFGVGAFTCTNVGLLITCTGGTIPGMGGSRTIEVTLRAPDANITIQNQAFVDPNNAIPEGNETNNTDALDTTVFSKINLQVVKNGPETVEQGQTDFYVLQLKNVGADPAFDVLVRDALPTGLIPILAFAETPEDSDFLCTVFENPINMVECRGTLDGSANALGDDVPTEVTIKISVFVTAEQGELDNEACMDPDDEITESNEFDNCSTFTTVVGRPDLSINKTASAGTVTQGEELVYSLNVSNVGSGPTTGPVTITDTVPTGLTIVSAFGSNGFTCTQVNPITCDNGGGSDAHAPGPITEITITTQVATTSSPLVNTAQVSQDAQEINAVNNSATVTTVVGGPAIDMALLSVTDTPDPVAKGDTYRYEILVANGGTIATGTFTVRVEFSSITGLALVSATGSEGFTCPSTLAATFDCTGTLAPGASTTITIILQATASAPGSVTATVTVDPGPSGGSIPEFDETNNTATAVTTISDALCTNCFDLVASELVESADPINVNDPVTYSFTVGNVGDLPSDQTDGVDDVAVSFLVLGDFPAPSFTAAAGWTCGETYVAGIGYSLDCTGELAAGEGAIFTITVTANVAGTDVLSSTGTVYSPTGLVESDSSNNTAPTVFTTVN